MPFDTTITPFHRHFDTIFINDANLQDTLLFRDYSSWGSGGFDEATGVRANAAEPEKAPAYNGSPFQREFTPFQRYFQAKREAKCKANFDDLVRRLGEFERSAELWDQLDLAGCDVWLGGNDNVAGNADLTVFKRYLTGI